MCSRGLLVGDVVWETLEVGFYSVFFFFQAEDGIRDLTVTGVQTCALPISRAAKNSRVHARSAARRSRSAREALGRQSPPPLTSASREPGERLAHPHAAAWGDRKSVV